MRAVASNLAVTFQPDRKMVFCEYSSEPETMKTTEDRKMTKLVLLCRSLTLNGLLELPGGVFDTLQSLKFLCVVFLAWLYCSTFCCFPSSSSSDNNKKEKDPSLFQSAFFFLLL